MNIPIIYTLPLFVISSVFAASVETPTLPASEASATAVVANSEELKRIYEEDQSDRKPTAGKGIDWNFVGPRDEARELKVKELIGRDCLKSGSDYYYAAMILQHAQAPDDYLLAHDLCVVAISKGEERAKWLAAASLDRFLVSIGRSQRFGTQFGGTRPGMPMKLRPTDPSVTDGLRRAFNVPALAEALAKEAKINEQFRTQNKLNQAPGPGR